MRKLLVSLVLSNLLWVPMVQAQTVPVELSYQSRAALAHDWALAFKSANQKFVELRVWQPGVARAVQNCPTCPAQPAQPILYIENVTKLTDIGALLLIEYMLSSGKTALAIMPSERIIGIYHGE